jgi:hypothetical protein
VKTAIHIPVAWLALAAMASTVAACDTARPTGSTPPDVPPAVASAPAAPVTARVDDLLAGGRLFGVTARDATAPAMEEIAADVGCRPTLLQLFASVERGISARTLRNVSGVPVLSIEPWKTGEGPDQPDWSLTATIDGRWDEKYTAIARAVVEYRELILIRFGHEMNGHWYPWGTANGNGRGEFVKAWRHLVSLFRDAGATNALWVWSPNILRGTSNRQLKDFWPGPKYVDIVGLTGYGVRETSPNITYRPTLKQVYALTDKPILLTEVGVQPGPEKRPWLAAFGPWLRNTPRVAGFIWNQITRDGDWRYDDTPGNLSAFKSGLADVDLQC